MRLDERQGENLPRRDEQDQEQNPRDLRGHDEPGDRRLMFPLKESATRRKTFESIIPVVVNRLTINTVLWTTSENDTRGRTIAIIMS